MTSGGKAVRILHTINDEVLGIKISAKAGDVRVFPVNIANELIVQRLAQGFFGIGTKANWLAVESLAKDEVNELLEKNRKKISTDDLNGRTMNCGYIPETGCKIKPDAIERDIENKKTGNLFNSLKVEWEDGSKVNIAYSGKRLDKILTDNWDEIKGRWVKLTGRGQGLERAYEIEFLE